RRYWWRYGEPRVTLRDALDALKRFIATPYVAKHRFFTFLDVTIAPDEPLVCIALAESFALGVLSSRAHVEWALAAGSRVGIGNDPRYNNSLCFDPFPFPDPPPELRQRIADVAERL